MWRQHSIPTLGSTERKFVVILSRDASPIALRAYETDRVDASLSWHRVQRLGGNSSGLAFNP